MIPLYPTSDKARKARNLAAVTSFERGSVPFARGLGLPHILDQNASPAAVTAAVSTAAVAVADCKVVSVSVSFDSDGKTVYNSKVE